MARHVFTWWEVELPQGWLTEQQANAVMLRSSSSATDVIIVEAAYGGDSAASIADLRHLAEADPLGPCVLQPALVGRHSALRGRHESTVVWYFVVDKIVFTARLFAGSELEKLVALAESILSTITADAPTGSSTRTWH